MRYSDIKEKHVYYADLTPAIQNEFGGTHLCLVLSKSQDQKTVNILSLTSKSSIIGNLNTKLKINLIHNLPDRLALSNQTQIDSFCIMNQVRNVSVSRIQNILDGKDDQNRPILANCYISNNEFEEIIKQFCDFHSSNLLQNPFAYHLDKILDFATLRLIQICYDSLHREINFNTLSAEFNYLNSLVFSIDVNYKFELFLNHNDIEKGILDFYNNHLVLLGVS